MNPDDITNMDAAAQPVAEAPANVDPIDTDYDAKLKANLEAKLRRPAKAHELVNADNDSDIVSETLWQIICELSARVAALEKKP